MWLRCFRGSGGSDGGPGGLSRGDSGKAADAENYGGIWRAGGGDGGVGAGIGQGKGRGAEGVGIAGGQDAAGAGVAVTGGQGNENFHGHGAGLSAVCGSFWGLEKFSKEILFFSE